VKRDGREMGGRNRYGSRRKKSRDEERENLKGNGKWDMV